MSAKNVEPDRRCREPQAPTTEDCEAALSTLEALQFLRSVTTEEYAEIRERMGL